MTEGPRHGPRGSGYIVGTGRSPPRTTHRLTVRHLCIYPTNVHQPWPLALKSDPPVIIPARRARALGPSRPTLRPPEHALSPWAPCACAVAPATLFKRRQRLARCAHPLPRAVALDCSSRGVVEDDSWWSAALIASVRCWNACSVGRRALSIAFHASFAKIWCSIQGLGQASCGIDAIGTHRFPVAT